ncbi:hypothetical protein QBC46DRAFT_111167 [Diplogelasinospora grovesii]|uniref:Uncharacterized protein n=1 Tax=Diplogelasinospora grovesii TaxID=303347 RepID=A0AAN6S5B9_9PEZI|nr:hypothetical protein QBC46DRAFT_111167 [Diplogelasinospora grovesii]
MDKCWFILRHADIPPPNLPPEGSGSISGALCLGHLVPGPRRLDEVINTSGPLKIPKNTPLSFSQSVAFSWKLEKGVSFAQTGNLGVPIAVAAGVTASASVDIGFQKTKGTHWEFESLETTTFRPSNDYLSDCLDDELVAAYISKHKSPLLGSWDIFMITGIKVARGAKMSSSETHVKQVGSGMELIAGAADIGETSEVSIKSSQETSHGLMSDFIWAVRLDKISKGVFNRSWGHRRYFSNTAAFDSSSEKPEDLLACEGIDGGLIYSLDNNQFAVSL